MEDTLWEMKKFRLIKSTEVLILVLMEDTLWAKGFDVDMNAMNVLILVLMEDTLWGRWFSSSYFSSWCLNPCFNGRYSLSSEVLQETKTA